MINDTHLHTSFSEDCGTPPEEVVKKAIERGMSDLCITDHYDPDFPGGGWMFDPDRYFEELTALREKYRDRIRIHIGIEMGLQPHLYDHFKKLRKDYPFEYAIGSVHVLLGDDPYYRDRYDMTDGEYFRAYFSYLLECVRSSAGLFDSLGHLDYVVRYGLRKAEEYSYEKYAEYIDPVLDIAVETGAALEINTGAVKGGLDFLHPHPDIVKRYLEKGGKRFTVGSDAHRAEEVGRGFERAARYLESLGVLTENAEENGLFLHL